MRKLFFIAVLAASMLSIDLAAFDIVKEGKPAAVIVLGRRTKLTLPALEVLQNSVEKCTGAKQQMIRPRDLSKVPADLNRIFIGDCNYAAGKNLKSSDLKVEEYLIKVDGKDLFLLANDKAAPQNKGKKKSGEEISSTGLALVSFLHNTSIRLMFFRTGLSRPGYYA